MAANIGGVLAEPYRINRKLRHLLESMLGVLPPLWFLRKCRTDSYPITLTVWFRQKVMGNNAAAYWPMHPASQVTYAHQVLIGKGTYPGYQPGCYIHAVNKVYMGDYVFIAPNVGIMSGNHDMRDMRLQTQDDPVRIGSYCWLGMNSMILPGVELGDFTVVGAGSIVTKSFSEGYCVIAGNPARVIRRLVKEECLRYEEPYTSIGYIPLNRFEEFRARKLNV
jgi:acetyltransferase-like isoleucine patch superfamily enzyme